MSGSPIRIQRTDFVVPEQTLLLAAVAMWLRYSCRDESTIVDPFRKQVVVSLEVIPPEPISSERVIERLSSVYVRPEIERTPRAMAIRNVVVAVSLDD